MATTLATKYSDAMKEQSWGHALFRPARSSVLQPGSCGYLDDNGKWHPVIANIENPPQDSPLPFSKPGRLSAMPPETHTWGPKSATDVLHKCVAFSAAADALAAGFPAEVQMALEFSSAKDFGAVLHCAHDVEERGYYFHEPFAQWAKKNAQALLQHCPDIKSHGLWIIKSTVETRDVNICAWSGRSKTVSMGFKVAIPAAGEIGPSGEFVKGGSADEWHHDSSDVNHFYSLRLRIDH